MIEEQPAVVRAGCLPGVVHGEGGINPGAQALDDAVVEADVETSTRP